MPKDQFGTYGEGMAHEPGDDPALRYAQRAIGAMVKEFAGEQTPRFVVVVETPPDGEVLAYGPFKPKQINVASSADDELDCFRLLLMATLSVRRSMNGETHAEAVAWFREALGDFLKKAQPPVRRRRRR